MDTAYQKWEKRRQERSGGQRRMARRRGSGAGVALGLRERRRLAQLAFGRVNDAARLALHSEEADLETLDLSAVAELKVTDKGVEIRFVDRLRALDALREMLEEKGGGAEELYRALTEAVGEEGSWEHG